MVKAEHDEYIHVQREPHPEAKLSRDLNTSVLRYMKLNRFKGILDNRKLYLCRGDLLGDKSEGTYSPPQIEKVDDFLIGRNVKNVIQSEKQWRERLPSTFYANCWCMARCDTHLMWNTYVPGGGGVAIRSSLRNLLSVIDNPIAIEYWSLDLTEVSYFDRERDEINDIDGFGAIVHKDIYFENENEVRIIHTSNYSGKDQQGVEIPVDLNVLIDAVILAPKAPDKRRDEVLKLLEGAELGHIPILPSRYDRLPG